MDIKKITVLGCGTMGSGIAQVAAAAGITVTLRDINDDLVGKGIETITKNLQKAIDKEKITAQQRDAILGKIAGTTNLKEAVKDAKIVIEAATENVEIKKSVFKELEALCPSDTILATNTSALSITEIASELECPERVIGMHFFNPVYLMDLVELIKGTHTCAEVLSGSQEFVEKLGKTFVVITEAPGFIVNRLLIPMINEAIFILMEGIASKEDIDQAMKLGANHPLGPLALADLIGLDVCLEIMKTFYKEFADSKYRPCPLLTKMVRGNLLGRKTGVGFYDYGSGTPTGLQHSSKPV